MPELGTIYGLSHAGEIRYVGKTIGDPVRRLRGHLRGAKSGDQLRVSRWLRSVGLKAEIIVLERCSRRQLNEAERVWIACLRRYGCRLTNLTDGGDGQSLGYRTSTTTKIKQSLAGRARYADPVLGPRGRETSAMGGRLLRDRPKSAEHRAKLSASLTGRTRGHHSEETRRKISAARKGKPGNHREGCTCAFHDGHTGAHARWGGDA